MFISIFIYLYMQRHLVPAHLFFPHVHLTCLIHTVYIQGKYCGKPYIILNYVDVTATSVEWRLLAIYIYIYVCILMYVNIYIYIYEIMCMYIYIYACTYCIYECIALYIYIHMCIYMYMYIYIYRWYDTSKIYGQLSIDDFISVANTIQTSI